jgi:hypothetical protein
MKRILIATFLLIFVCGSVAAQKIAIKCPSATELKNGIVACPDTGCGPSLDPLLNKQKNIRSDDREPVTKTIQDLKDLADPVAGFKVGNTREKLTALGEGDKIRVVAFALVARKGGAESCNCKLTAVKDTDNHIVLVDTLKRKKSGETPKVLLSRREEDSITAEFAPRPRLDHPNLTRANLQPLIDASGGALKVRITGLLMFDSEHSLGGHLKRVNNWEIHPVLGLEFCPKGKTCTADSDDNWKELGQ